MKRTYSIRHLGNDFKEDFKKEFTRKKLKKVEMTTQLQLSNGSIENAASLDLSNGNSNNFLEQRIKIKRCIPKKYFDQAIMNDFEFIDELFAEDKVDINSRDPSNGYTLLHYAIFHKNSSAKCKLISLNADLKMKSSLFCDVLSPEEFIAVESNFDSLSPQSSTYNSLDHSWLEYVTSKVSGELTIVDFYSF